VASISKKSSVGAIKAGTQCMNTDVRLGQSLKGNIVANYLGQIWRALMAIAFVPVYIKYLGIESYGLIGIFALLQAWLGLLDIGMKPALSREMARFTGGAHNTQSIRDLLRSIEIVAIAIAALAAISLAAASGWLAADWVKGENLPKETVTRAFAVMSVVTGLRFIEDIYVSCIVGLQRQVFQNIVSSMLAALRGFGAVGILILISPTIEAFFAWQGLVSLITVIVFASAIHRALPKSLRPARFSLPALQNVWRFAAGMMTITFLALLLTQVDKILLSRLLTLKAFGYYSFAVLVASGLSLITGPIAAAFYPRFTALVTRGDDCALSANYHLAAQLVTTLTGTIAIFLIFFGDVVLLLWTKDVGLTQEVAPLMRVLVLGTLLNALMWIPYHLQLAHGWTALTIRTNIVAVGILVPAILLIVPVQGAIGAAWIWVALNTGYLSVSIFFMHQRLLPTEKWRWYVQDLILPLGIATATAELCRLLIPQGLGELGEFIVLLLVGGCILASAAVSAAMLRKQLVRHLQKFISQIISRKLPVWHPPG